MARVMVSLLGGRPLPNMLATLHLKPDYLYVVVSQDSLRKRGNYEKLINALPNHLRPSRTIALRSFGRALFIVFASIYQFFPHGGRLNGRPLGRLRANPVPLKGSPHLSLLLVKHLAIKYHWIASDNRIHDCLAEGPKAAFCLYLRRRPRPTPRLALILPDHQPLCAQLIEHQAKMPQQGIADRAPIGRTYRGLPFSQHRPSLLRAKNTRTEAGMQRRGYCMVQ